jgi:hypothetical protein
MPQSGDTKHSCAAFGIYCKSPKLRTSGKFDLIPTLEGFIAIVICELNGKVFVSPWQQVRSDNHFSPGIKSWYVGEPEDLTSVTRCEGHVLMGICGLCFFLFGDLQLPLNLLRAAQGHSIVSAMNSALFDCRYLLHDIASYVQYLTCHWLLISAPTLPTSWWS